MQGALHNIDLLPCQRTTDDVPAGPAHSFSSSLSDHSTVPIIPNACSQGNRKLAIAHQQLVEPATMQLLTDECSAYNIAPETHR
jgi:hypothetical protein